MCANEEVVPDTGRDFSHLLEFELGRLPAFRHFKVQLPITPEYKLSMLSFLNRLLSTSSSTSGLETLELLISSWDEDPDSHATLELFSSSPDWDTLDDVLAEKFVSLRNFVLHWDHEVTDYFQDNLPAKYQTWRLSINDLFPKLRRGQCTLETQFAVCPYNFLNFQSLY